MVAKATVEYSVASQSDLLRLSLFLFDKDPEVALEVFEIIKSAINMLADHPLAGRLVESALRELVISHGRTGYVASYHYDRFEHKVLILAIKHQRENDYH